MGGLSRLNAVGLVTPQQLQASLDVRVGGIQLGGPGISIEGICNLIVTRLVLFWN